MGLPTEEALGQAILCWSCPSATVQAGLPLEVLPAAPAVVPGSAFAVACNSHENMASRSAKAALRAMWTEQISESYDVRWQ